ncbi:MAG: metallophosphoesterase [Selenomonadaceae bacterium]|nr:metallophosphoesterase [Selenomonadaceae bacterium]
MKNRKSFINNAEEIIPPVNDLPYKRILAIGDVHASFDKLISLWKKLSVTEEDLVIFLGDYLYGLGDKNIETLQWLIEHKKQKNIIFLRGNVDETYLHHLFDLNGNFFTRLNSRVVSGIKNTAVKKPSFPNKIFDFLNNLPLYHRMTIGGKEYYFCHAGINVGVPLEEQKKTYLIDHPKLKDFYQNYSGDAVIVVGHKSPKKIYKKLPQLFTNYTEKLDLTKPLKVPNRNILMLDTHAKAEGGPLSCVDLLSGEIWQNDDDLDSIIFVCSGNSCRSPMAKYIMRYLLAEKGLSDKVVVDSAGCNTHGGGRLSSGADEMLRKYHIPFSTHISKPFDEQEYRKFKCVIALDEGMLQLAKKISNGDPDNKIRLFTGLDEHELKVEDPFHTGDYEKAYAEIKLGCSALLKELLNK